ncbi:ATP-binding protein [Crocinitomicaceae bacterium]|nr:ATP-binding protein [Crocinitomicaceae bacterium]
MNEHSKISNFLVSFLTQSIDGVQMVDAEGTIVYLNEVAKERLGIDLSTPTKIWEFEPFFKGVDDWRTHMEKLRGAEPIVLRTTNYHVITKEEIPVEVTAKHVALNGTEMVVAFTRDISALVHQEQLVQRQENMFKAISFCSALLLSNFNIHETLPVILKQIGEAVEVDRTYLFTIHESKDGRRVMSQAFEWNSGEAEPQIDNPELQNLEAENFKLFLNVLENDQFFQCITAELNYGSTLRKILEAQEILSLLILPVFFKEELWGYIGFDACREVRSWNNSELALLKTLASIIAESLKQKEDINEIESLAAFPLENPAPVLRIDFEGNLLFHNTITSIEKALFRRTSKQETLTLHELFLGILDDLKRGSDHHYYEVETIDGQFYAISARIPDNKNYANLYFSDITQLKIAENELSRSREIVDNILSNLEDVIWSASYPEMELLFVSPSAVEFFGVHQEELEKDGKFWQKGVSDEDNHRISSALEDLHTRKKRSVELEYLISVGADTKKWVFHKIHLREHPMRLEGFIYDITAEKENDQLKDEARRIAVEANRAKEVFVSSMSHEIRTPLNVILGLSKELLDHTEDEQTKSWLDNIVYAGTHLHSIVENVLDFAKIDSGQFTSVKEDVFLEKELDSIYQMMNELAKNKFLTLSAEIDSSCATQVSFDRKRFRQVIINLLSNAIKFTEHGEVKLSASIEEQPHHVVVEVQDTGIGMTSEFLEKIFDKFTQEEDDSAEKVEGTGLGMPITKEILLQLGGDIQITSKKGKGTTVKVMFPYELSVLQTVNSVQNDNYGILDGKKILLVEDNKLNVIVAESILKRFGLRISTAGNGQEALDVLQVSTFDLILMDLQMPIMDGLSATQAIRNELKLDIPIIALSANALSTSRKKCLDHGMDDYITKPFDKEALLSALVSQLSAVHERRYDLSALTETTGGDTDMLAQLVALFVQTIPSELEIIQQATKDKEYKRLKSSAHKIKPNILLFGINEAKEDIIFLNYFEENDPTVLGQLPLVSKRFCELVLEVIRELKEDYEV